MFDEPNDNDAKKLFIGKIPLPRDLVVILSGPIAAKGDVAAGGYEAANRRNIDLLRQHGLQVNELPYPILKGKVISKTIAYARAFRRIASDLHQIRRTEPDSPVIFHLTGLYRQFAYGELALLLTARKLGIFVVYDVRAGQFVDSFNARSSLYRIIIRKSLSLADFVMVEGRPYQEFITDLGYTQPAYFPNYVDDKHIHQTVIPEARHHTEQIRLIYFGRIVQSKNIETAIATVDQLIDRGVDASLDIVGPGENSYTDKLRSMVRHPKRVRWLGPKTHGELLNSLTCYHFFVFPTIYIGEGQSNALTEAMAKGVVPICSDAGFSADLVGDCGKLLPRTASAEDYVEAIKGCLANGWDKYSARCLNRIQNNFSATAIAEHLLRNYKTVLQDYCKHC